MTHKALSRAAASQVTVRLRLEDAVALLFFVLTLGVRIFFRELHHDTVSPADVLIIIPPITLLLAKELAHYFASGRAGPSLAPSENHRQDGCAAAAGSAQLRESSEARGSARADQDASAAPTDDLRKFVRPYWEIIRDWFPFFAVLAMYYSLWGDATHLVFTHDRDAALIAWDQRLFGFQASVAIQRFIRPPLTAWMQFAYLFHLFNIPLVACFVYLRRPRGRFREMMCGILLVTFLGLLGYIVIPAIGPMYTLRAHFTVPLEQPLTLLNRELEFVDFARIRRDVFPSLHVGMSFVVWLYAYRNSRALFWILSPLILSLWASTVYLRYHYVVDCIAGFLLAPFAFVLANWLFKRFGEIPVSVPVPWIERFRRLPFPVVAQTGTPPKEESSKGTL